MHSTITKMAQEKTKRKRFFANGSSQLKLVHDPFARMKKRSKASGANTRGQVLPQNLGRSQE